MRIISFIVGVEVTEAVLEHLGLCLSQQDLPPKHMLRHRVIPTQWMGSGP